MGSCHILKLHQRPCISARQRCLFFVPLNSNASSNADVEMFQNVVSVSSSSARQNPWLYDIRCKVDFWSITILLFNLEFQLSLVKHFGNHLELKLGRGNSGTIPTQIVAWQSVKDQRTFGMKLFFESEAVDIHEPLSYWSIDILCQRITQLSEANGQLFYRAVKIFCALAKAGSLDWIM